MCSLFSQATRLPSVSQRQALPVASKGYLKNGSSTLLHTCGNCNGDVAQAHMVMYRGTLQPGLKRGSGLVRAGPFPFDLAWSPNIDAQSVAPQLFAASLLPYLVFLGFLTSSGKTPKLTLIGFWFLLAFVGATIPAGIYAKIHYGTTLANVDWLHGSAESLLTITNLLIVVGLRQGIKEAEAKQQAAAAASEATASQPGQGSEVPVSSAATRSSSAGDS